MNNLDQIELIFVEDEYQGNRIGEALMKNAIERFDDNHVEVRKLYIVYGNDNVIGCYQKYGFYPLNIGFRQIM